MRKRAILAFMLAAALFLSGCALVEKDTAVDNATVIIQLGDQTVTKAQVNSAVDYQLSYTAQMYSLYYGYSYDTTSDTAKAEALDTVLNGFAEQLVKVQKAKELGFDVLTDEEDAAVKEDAQSQFDSDKEYVKSQYFSDTTLEGDALEEAILAKMTELGLEYDTYYYPSAKATAAQDKLQEYVIKDVTVSDEEIQAEFDSRVESAKTTYASSLSSYGATVNSNGTVYYAPAGYRYVKHILRKFPDDTQTALTDLQSQITEKTTSITDLETSISALGEDVAEDDENRVKLNADKAAAEQEKADLQAQYDAALEAAYAALQPTVDEVLAKIAAGEDFDTLMAAYGEDPGMQKSPQMENGYAVCENFSSFDSAFTAAAMALEKVGDVSPAVRGQNGIHIIKYVSDIQEGPVALDTVKDTISSSLLSQKQDDAYTAQIEAWVKEADVKIYKDRMDQ